MAQSIANEPYSLSLDDAITLLKSDIRKKKEMPRALMITVWRFFEIFED
jgi:hypothetical protein